MGIQNGEPTISMDSIDQNLSIARINSDNNVESLNNDEFSLQLEDRQLQRHNFNSKSGESYKNSMAYCNYYKNYYSFPKITCKVRQRTLKFRTF